MSKRLHLDEPSPEVSPEASPEPLERPKGAALPALARAAETLGIKIHVYYTPKGGVGKTYCARRAEETRILFVDGDPQLSLSSPWAAPPEGTIGLSNMIRLAFANSMYLVKMPDAIPAERGHLYAPMVYTKWFADVVTHADRYASEFTSGYRMPENRHTFGSIRALLLATALYHGCTDVVVDLNPDSKFFNGMFVMSADVWHVPVTPDDETLNALKRLPKIVRGWTKTWGEIYAMTQRCASPFLIKTTPPTLHLIFNSYPREFTEERREAFKKIVEAVVEKSAEEPIVGE